MKKIVLVIMDGIGFGKKDAGDAVFNAYTPTLDLLLEKYPFVSLKAHGEAVGLPSDDDMGNSEVGHNALGCGQIYSQGAKLVNESIATGRMFESPVWKDMIDAGTVHFIGLLSDGNVHSNISHLIDMLKQTKKDGVKRTRVHILLDGRDVPTQSADLYIDMLEKALKELNDDTYDGRIASGGGRMKVTMDRYQANWDMVKQGWETHVEGIGKQFNTALEAIKAYRSEKPDIIDQDLPPFVIAKDGKPVGTIDDGDSVILFNFRGDRAIEISMAFDNKDFNAFKKNKNPKVKYAGMLQYDGDLQLPHNFLVAPPHITNTLSELLVKNNISQYAVSETQKYGHVTYFWNGNRSGKTSEELETFEEIPSDTVSFDERPWMKSAQVADAVIKATESGKYGFIRCNFPNGDMVGHTGSMQATLIAVESVDLALSRIAKAIESNPDYLLIITADHGNADDMLEKGAAKTAHSLNKVPFIVCDTKYFLKDKDFGLANVAPTIAKIMGMSAPDCWLEAIC